MSDQDLRRIAVATATVRGELARAEAKASALLTVSGAALTVILAAQAVHRVPLVAAIVGGGAAVTTAAAIALLALVIYPRLAGGQGGWLGYADLTGDQVRARAADGAVDDADQLAILAGLARHKFRLIGAAVVLLLVTVGLVLAAAGLAVALGVSR